MTGSLPDADATTGLHAAGLTDAEIPAVLQTWAEEANIRRKGLTSAQLKKAYGTSAVNAATGQPWTRDEAIDALRGQGYTPIAAADYLNI